MAKFEPTIYMDESEMGYSFLSDESLRIIARLEGTEFKDSLVFRAELDDTG